MSYFDICSEGMHLITVNFTGELFKEYYSELSNLIGINNLHYDTCSNKGKKFSAFDVFNYSFSKETAEEFFKLNDKYASKYKEINSSDKYVISVGSFTATYYPEEDYSECESWITHKFYGHNKIRKDI